MKRIAWLVLLASVPAWADGPVPLRIATFNVAMGLEAAGQLAAALSHDGDPRLQQLAETLQRVRPDIVLLNEFDFDPAIDAAALLNANYLGRGQRGQRPLRYDHHFRGEVNTGVDSGLDLDGNGARGDPGDAWGFGHFPGQYGMLLLSRFPLPPELARTFTRFQWSALPGAHRPTLPDGRAFHSDAVWDVLRLSSKSHWDITANVAGRPLHILAFHPTPPVFDGPEDRNGHRNFDEIRLWRDYVEPGDADWLVDDRGQAGGIRAGEPFVIAGDFNADPHDGDSLPRAAAQLLGSPAVDASCVPRSRGAVEAAENQAGVNRQHRGEPAADTSDFDDRRTGNLRLDYVLPSSGLNVSGCGVYWPAAGHDGSDLVDLSDHRLVWLDISW
jgi:endonuclease/exonuclease/phosphatase family metal-dependent hydrolase